MFHEIAECRICGSSHLRPVLNLGVQAMTGVFPRSRDAQVESGPLELVRCETGDGDERCGLVQLRHSYDSKVMYGAGYGYRSSLNRSMAGHLEDVVAMLSGIVDWTGADLIVDIGSNDGTLLSFYPVGRALVGVDPTASVFRKYYRKDIQVIEDFFSAERLAERFPGRRARVVTSIAMFYDLRDPLDFMRQVRDVLDEMGIWHFEQSYLPMMLDSNAYDTVCHEHVEYYALRQIEWMCRRAGLKIIRIETNPVNGGSFAVTAARAESPYVACSDTLATMLTSESAGGLLRPETYERFRDRVAQHRDELRAALSRLRGQGLKILGYGASTKGNVLLQYCGLGPEDLPCIADVNESKYGCFTPGTGIPIVSEAEARAMKPDVFLVLPWHFKDFICERERAFLEAGGRLLFPLPQIECIQR